MSERNGPGLTISCDDCAMRSTPACHDCVVSFVIGDDGEAHHAPLVLDLAEARVVRWLSTAGLVPELRYRDAG